MGHFFFVILHLVGVMLGFWILVFSLPAHFLYALNRGRKKSMQEQTNLLKEQVELLKKNQADATSEKGNQ
jgi:hypothetical protein